MVDDEPAGDVRDEGVFLAPEDGELRGGEEVGGFFCERDGDDEVVEVLGEEVVEGGLVEAGEPGRGDGAVGVAGAGDDVAAVALGGGGRARVGGEGEDVHAHGARDAGDLPADAAVAQDADPLACFVAQVGEGFAGGGGGPGVGGLPGVEERVAVGGGEHGHDDPFGDLGAVDAGGGGEGDGGAGVDGVVGDVVGAGGDEVDEFEGRAGGGGVVGEGGEGYEDGGGVEYFWWWSGVSGGGEERGVGEGEGDVDWGERGMLIGERGGGPTVGDLLLVFEGGIREADFFVRDLIVGIFVSDTLESFFGLGEGEDHEEILLLVLLVTPTHCRIRRQFSGGLDDFPFVSIILKR